VETWEAIAARRNVRSYRDRPIPRGHLDRILDAGRRSPSSRNQQLWDFVVVTDKKQLEELSKVWQGAGHVGASAATVALVAPLVDDPDTRETIQYDLGQVTLSMMLAAADLGIGSGHAWVRDQPLARKVLQMPQDRECAWLIAFGYPSDRPLAPLKNHDRRDFADVVHRDHW
jgi:nitroreductase